MRLLQDFSRLWTLPLGSILVSWVGAKLGARAMFMLLPPLSVMVLHTGRYLSADLDAASSAARLSMLSVPMLFCWAIPYFHFCRWFDGRLSSRQEEMVASSIASTVAAFLIQEAYRPWWTPLTTRPAAQLVGVIGILLLAALLLRLPVDERVPVSAIPTPMTLFARVAIVIFMVGLLLASRSFPVPVVLALLGTLPRMTFEMAVSTHVTNGPTAARQLLASLPIGVTTVVIWCAALVQLPSRLPAWMVFPAAYVLTLTWSAVLTVGYLRIFGIYRPENGLFAVGESLTSPKRMAVTVGSPEDGRPNRSGHSL